MRLGLGILFLGVLLGGLLTGLILRWRWPLFFLPAVTDNESGGTDSERICREVPLDAIVGNPYHPRAQMDEAKLDELACSIEEHGVITPIQVQQNPGEDTYQLIVGRRRVEACRRLGRETIPAVVRDLEPEELREVSFVENVHAESLNPVELARGYERLRREFRHESAEELGQRIGKSTQEVRQYEWILDLSRMAQDALSRGMIDLGTARNLLEISPEEQRNFIKYVNENNPEQGEITERLAHLKGDAGRNSEVPAGGEPDEAPVGPADSPNGAVSTNGRSDPRSETEGTGTSEETDKRTVASP